MKAAQVLKIACLFCAVILPADAIAQFLYTTNGGTITITGYAGPGGAVVIPETINSLPVTSIGGSTPLRAGAFFYCYNLTSVTIPNSVTNIGAQTFVNCTNLTSVTIPNSVTNIGGGAFRDCGLTNVVIGSGVTGFGTYPSIPFLCLSLRSITVDTNNPDYSSSTGVLFNKNQTTLVQCPAGKAGTYTIPDSVNNIGANAFYCCFGLTNVMIPNSVHNIDVNAFSHCTGLTNIIIPNSVSNIGYGAFDSCTNLTDVTIPNSVTNIGEAAFESCLSLTSVLIPNSVTSIGQGAFIACTSLTSVLIPDSVTNIGEYAFIHCNSLTAITVDTNNPNYSSIAGVLFNKDQTTLIEYPFGRGGSYTVPNNVTSIQTFAFESTALTSVTIPNSVTNIGTGAFGYCASLTEVYFQGNAPSLGSGVFYYDNLAGHDNATIYYLPGTMGWGKTFGSVPTALWTLPYPLILNGSLRFGGPANVFSFNVSWATNIPVIVDACTNLAQPVWQPVQTNVFTDGLFSFSDPQSTNHPMRFYRLRSP